MLTVQEGTSSDGIFTRTSADKEIWETDQSGVGKGKVKVKKYSSRMRDEELNVSN
jgi:hypothetical protein